MRVVARSADSSNAPAEITRLEPPGQIFLTVGREYEVHALSVFEGRVTLQIVDDLQKWPQWYSAWFFDLVDPTPAGDWIVGVFRGEPSLVIGPPFVASDLKAYERMVALEAREVQLFRERVRKLETRSDGT